ncbi:MAG: hypothetical protein U0893_21660 [Chloroflexota bacterium]
MSVDPRYILVGMGVVGTDGEVVGTVKEVRGADFLVDRPFARDVYVPIEFVQAIIDETADDPVDPHVVLTIRADSVDDAGWPHPH